MIFCCMCVCVFWSHQRWRTLFTHFESWILIFGGHPWLCISRWTCPWSMCFFVSNSKQRELNSAVTWSCSGDQSLLCIRAWQHTWSSYALVTCITGMDERMCWNLLVVTGMEGVKEYIKAWWWLDTLGRHGRWKNAPERMHQNLVVTGSSCKCKFSLGSVE